ncbi:tyrosine-type recombinase/integrase [Halopenitus sp. H-Gu1]|uniref:tyrosine-type recombinase/integrase n=1 Tax=Halopenitus sp. H-Gu1 TaxID=3242697 RepID=UPI00359D8BCD
MSGLPPKIETLHTRIKRSENLSPEDKDALLKFSSELGVHNYSVGRWTKLLQHCTMMAGDSYKYSPDELPEPDLADIIGESKKEKDAAKKYVSWINATYDSEESKRDHRVALRMFGGHFTAGDYKEEKPSSVEWISADLPRDYDPKPDPTKMWWWDEHIVPVLDNAKYARNKAAVAVDWDAGPRSEEFQELAVGDVSDHKYGMEITVDGKRGRRSIVLISSVPYLRRWLEAHPRGNDPDAPLWSDLDTGRDVSYNMKLKMLRAPVKRAVDNGDLRKPSKMVFTRMRKSSASYLARKNVSQNHIEKHHGWVKNSDEARRYIDVFREDTAREVARAHGVDVSEDEIEAIGPVQCPRCQRDTPRGEAQCMWCGQALGPKGVEKIEERQERLFDSALEAEGQMKERLKNVQSELEELRSLGLEI